MLDQQHYGLEKVKERVLEHLAVMKLREQDGSKSSKKKNTDDKTPRKNVLPTILCFVGPPGVGKTSIGRSIAESLGREFVKVSLGGVHDEAEIRGHRRTYVGAMPGKIMQGMAQAGTKNPVFMLDEVDKLGSDFRGDPSAALLEALDPEQNFEFTDHYLGEPFDLSDVMFITTANVLHTIPGPLRDRLEIVEYTGYTYEEKFNIAQQYLIDQVREGAGLKKTQFSLTDGALREVIEHYTREAGVRALKREIAKVARKVARQIAEKETKNVKVEKRTVSDYLGPIKVIDTLMELEDQIGLVNGLAWTSTGGEVMHIEAALATGQEGYTITGQLGEVMKESVKAAYTYVRSHAEELGITPQAFKHNHVHIHAPEGAVPKDGPSAGIALTTVITSVFAEKKIKHTVAMTGEVTLRGRVLPIGGLKEKLIAAHRAGVKQAFIPKQNEKDLVDVPEKVKKDITIIPVEHVSEVLDQALIWKK
ncbi:endopeptidase La [Candidatus Woesebacteria bacterium]|nr:endopeptidase La [Candidatus Woesebacteria bacterium]